MLKVPAAKPMPGNKEAYLDNNGRSAAAYRSSPCPPSNALKYPKNDSVQSDFFLVVHESLCNCVNWMKNDQFKNS